MLMLALILNPAAKRRRTKDAEAGDAAIASASGSGSIPTSPVAGYGPSDVVGEMERAHIQAVSEVPHIHSHDVEK